MSFSPSSTSLRIGLAAGMFAAFAAMSPARADPYSLPIAQSGSVAGAPSVAAGTVSARQLAAQVGLAQFTSPTWQPGELRHVVMFRYRKDTSAAQRSEVTARFLHLAQDSRRPDGSHPVVSIETGMQSSGEGTDGGLEQAFIVTFRSAGDRNFYVGKPVVTDPNFLIRRMRHSRNSRRPFSKR